MSFAVFSDCTCNLPGYLLRKLNIQIIGCTYTVDGKPVDYDGDIERFNAREFYDMMRAGKTISTSLLNTQIFLNAFRPVLEAGEDVIYVGMSSGISGTFHAACMAADELMEAFPGRIVRPVDSRGCGLGTGILTCVAADLRAKGLDANTAGTELDDAADHLCQYFTVGDLVYLRRTGRISAASAAIGTMLGIKPLLWGDNTGHIIAKSKCRGRKKAIDAILEQYVKKVRKPELQRVAISHGDCLEEAKALAERVKAIAQPKELILCPHEPFSGSHVGPGMLALFFFGETR